MACVYLLAKADAPIGCSHLLPLFIGATMTDVFDPMAFVVSGSGGLPAGAYSAVFEAADYLPEEPPDPMTGRGGRQWPKVVFRWRIAEGPEAGKEAIRETPVGTSSRVGYTQVCGWLVGKTLGVGDKGGLQECVGKRYLLTVGNRTTKEGVPTAWTHVVNAMRLPGQ
jgi:hypothetical protein